MTTIAIMIPRERPSVGASVGSSPAQNSSLIRDRTHAAHAGACHAGESHRRSTCMTHAHNNL